jgi:hypothetical protein
MLGSCGEGESIAENDGGGKHNASLSWREHQQQTSRKNFREISSALKKES